MGSSGRGSRWADLGRPPLRAGALRAALLAPAGPLARLEVLDEVGSTNAELVRLATADPDGWPHLSALTADSQTAGRGRLGRTWTAPPRSGIAVSVLLRPLGLHPPVPGEAWSWLPLLAGLAVSSAVRDVAGLAAGVKWPNDVLVGQRKLCGVLTEAIGGGSAAGGGGVPAGGGAVPAGAGTVPAAVVVGIGLNASTTRAELPVPTATSLVLEGATSTDRDTVLRAVLRSLAAEVGAWAAAGGDAQASGLAGRVRAACTTLGRPVRVALPGGGELTGTAEDLDAHGRLLVRPGAEPAGPAGAVERAGLVAVAAGDVVHVR